MLDNNHNEVTQPVPMENTPIVKKLKRWPWIVTGVVIFIALTVIGGLIGYQDGINQRKAYESSQTLVQASTQYDLGVVDLQQDRLQTALSRFEYVISLNPNFPGVQEKLAEVLTKLNLTKVPSSGLGQSTAEVQATTGTETEITPTSDNRSKDQLYQQIKQDLANKQWSDAITTIEGLRKLDITYQAIHVDGMYYLALQYQGVQLITIKGQLEQGLYDLSLAQTFGPLNDQATNFQTWAKLYVAGAAYSEVNWSMVLSYFESIYQAYPDMIDANGVTAQQRYEQAAAGYADSLVKSNDFCKAETYYEKAMQVSTDSNLSATLVAARTLCTHSSATVVATASLTTQTTTPTITPTPDGVVTEVTSTTETPTTAVTVTPTVEPTIVPPSDTPVTENTKTPTTNSPASTQGVTTTSQPAGTSAS